MKSTGIKIRLHPENPIDVPESDPFQYDTLIFRPSVERLARLIPDIETPFTVGIYGSWGAGKTSFMKMLQMLLEKDGQFATFWFDAWQYENETSLLIPFISKLTNKVSSGKHKKLLESIKKISTSVALIGADTFLNTITGGKNDLKKTVDILDIYEKHFVNLYDKWVGEVDRFKSEFNKLTDAIRQNRKAIVIFIDDLDRCLPENVVKLMENIKHFLSVDKCIFIIGIDKEILSKGIQARYGHNLISGDEYLEKIINLSFYIPVAGYMDQNEFIIDKMKRATTSEWFVEMEKEIGLFASIVSGLGINNPRRLRVLSLRYLFFLDMEDYPNYIVELVAKLIAYRELFRDAYEQKKLNGKIDYFPETLGRDEDAPSKTFRRLTFEQIEERSCRGFAVIATGPNYASLAKFTEETKEMLTFFDSTDEQLESNYDKIKQTGAEKRIKALETLINKHVYRDSDAYFYLIDFLFSLS